MNGWVGGNGFISSCFFVDWVVWVSWWVRGWVVGWLFYSLIGWVGEWGGVGWEDGSVYGLGGWYLG